MLRAQQSLDRDFFKNRHWLKITAFEFDGVATFFSGFNCAVKGGPQGSPIALLCGLHQNSHRMTYINLENLKIPV